MHAGQNTNESITDASQETLNGLAHHLFNTVGKMADKIKNFTAGTAVNDTASQLQEFDRSFVALQGLFSGGGRTSAERELAGLVTRARNLAQTSISDSTGSVNKEKAGVLDTSVKQLLKDIEPVYAVATPSAERSKPTSGRTTGGGGDDSCGSSANARFKVAKNMCSL